MIKPEEVVKLLRTVGLTYEDMWDPTAEHILNDGTKGLGNTNDLVRMCFFGKDSNAILLPCLGREDMRLEWILIIKDDAADIPDDAWEGFVLQYLQLLKTSDAPSAYGIEGVGQMTAGQYMDAVYRATQNQTFGSREELVGIRRGQYNISRHRGHKDQTFREFCQGDYWLVDVAEDEGLNLSPEAQARVDWYFSKSLDATLASNNDEVTADG